MPDTMSKERISFIRAYGAEVVLTPGAEGMAGSVRKAEQISAETGAFLPYQFDNPANKAIHRTTTGREILADLPDVDAVFGGIGSAGTIVGIGMAFRDVGSKAEVVGIEPAESPLLTEGRAGPHKIQGIGANFVPGNYDADCITRIVKVKGDDAIAMTRRLSREEGIFAGISSGAAVAAALEYAKNNKNKKVVAILPDGGDRYLSTGIFD
jgi:cysteine synthase